APMPTCASGISGTWPSTIGRRAVFCACLTVCSSISLAQEISLSLMCVGMAAPFPVSLSVGWFLACGRRDSNTHHRCGAPASSPLDDDHVVSRSRWTPGRDSHPRLVVCSHAPELL